jgi:hypothetical protein
MSVGNKYRFCELSEYCSGVAERVLEHELSIKGLYLVMFELGKTSAAARYPALINDVHKNEKGATKVEFQTYDDDLRILSRPLRSYTHNGLMSPTGLIVPPNHEVTEGYFKGYEDASDLELEMMGLLAGGLTSSLRS